MKVLKKNKGFTLVELIVVIAIIGILAAVLIPRITGYIDKGRVSNDKTELRNMNQDLTLFSIEVDVPLDVHSAFNFLKNNKGWSFVPSSKSHMYWFDSSTNKFVLESNDAIGLSGAVVFAAESDNDIKDVGAIHSNPDLILVDQGNNPLAKAVNEIRELANEIDSSTRKAKFVSILSNLTASNTIKTKLNDYSPDNTIYINNLNMGLPKEVNNKISANNVVFSLGLRMIPSSVTSTPIKLETKDNAPISLNIPNSVRLVQEGAFSNITTQNEIISSSRVFWQEGSVSASIQALSNISIGNNSVLSSLSYSEADNFDLHIEYLDDEDVLLNTIVRLNMDEGEERYQAIQVALSTYNVQKWYIGYSQNIEFNSTSETLISSFNAMRYNKGNVTLYRVLAYDTNDDLIGYLDNIGYFSSVDITYLPINSITTDPYLQVRLPKIDFENFVKIQVWVSETIGNGETIINIPTRYDGTSIYFTNLDQELAPSSRIYVTNADDLINTSDVTLESLQNYIIYQEIIK